MSAVTLEVLDLTDVMEEVDQILHSGSASATSTPVGSAVVSEETVNVVDERTWS